MVQKREAYIGHDSQLFGVEEHRLIGGKGDGIRLFQVRNGQGLEFTVSADRGADISRLSYQGLNFGFFPVNGYIAPAYYDDKGNGWLKTCNLGFLATCGWTNVGVPSVDAGESLGLHGKANNTPAENIYWERDEDEIRIHASLCHAGIFAEKLIQKRIIACSLKENRITITDKVINIGDKESPLMVLYHINIGYPLLDEDSILDIRSDQVTPRNDHAKEGFAEWNKVIPPQAGFEEMCYYHHFAKEGLARIFQPKFKKGLAIRFDPKDLDEFVQWKMMGIRDYVMGLEPGNCHADGRDKMRKEGKLKFIQPGEEKKYQVDLEIIEKM
ncbi:MAG: aldose 1-epimerase family protein [Flexilinea sp.]